MQSIVVNCPVIPEDLLNDYAYEAYYIDGECCKTYKTISCKEGSNEYKVIDKIKLIGHIAYIIF